MNRDISKYYNVLGISEKSSLAEIKKAYRKRAKELHPDINKTPNAKEQFILLNEAYEYLQKVKTGKSYNEKKNKYAKTRRNRKTQKEWTNVEQERARRRAAYFASIRFDDFVSSEFYKNTVALDTLMDFLSFFSVLSILIGIPIFGYIHQGWGGVFFGLIIIFITVSYWTDILIHNKPELDYKEFFPALFRLIKTRTFLLVFCAFLNFYLVLKICLSTLVTLEILTMLFAGSIAIGELISIKLNSYYKKLVFIGIAPGIVNLFFLLNFLFVTNEVKETYSFVRERRMTMSWFGSQSIPEGRSIQETTLINLENNSYDEFMGIRIFFDFDDTIAPTITYTFADGLFGIKVAKSYEFK